MKEQLYNLQKIIDLSDNDPTFIKDMVDMFINEIPRDLEHLAVAVIEDDRASVHDYAHKMKPSLDMFGLSCLSDMLILEAWGKSKDEMEIKEHFMRINQELDMALIQLKRDF
ncbi:MAG: Hpt domain-containing protein [Nonlabens sp.]|uniref:Hpt domain-containing protein n=1 Tax=Nonlabens sp. TaxID=1888209 RepID=UPI003EF3F32D